VKVILKSNDEKGLIILTNQHKRHAMKNCQKLVIAGVFSCFLALMAGCATSELIDKWSDSSFRGPSLKKVLVISVSLNPMQRHNWEDAFSVELATHNVAGTPSYRVFPDAVPDTNQVMQIIRSDGFDGVLVIRRLPAETTTEFVPRYTTSQKRMRYYPQTDRLMTYYAVIHHDAYIDTEKVDIRSIDVWATRNDGQMIWSATSETPEPNSLKIVRPEIVNLVLSELTKQHIIASAR
jgi:hypothetical protein